MIHLAMESDVSAENAPRLQQPLGKPSGFPTAATATTTTPVYDVLAHGKSTMSWHL